MFDGNDLLFESGHLYNNDDQTNRNLHFYNENDTLKFDDASLAVLVESEDGLDGNPFPDSSTNQIDSEINNVAQSDNWIDYESVTDFRSDQNDVESYPSSLTGPTAFNTHHNTNEDEQEMYFKRDYDYERVRFDNNQNDELYLHANNVVYNVKQSGENLTLATPNNTDNYCQPNREDEFLYSYDSSANLEDEHNYAGLADVGDAPLVDGFYSADEDDAGACGDGQFYSTTVGDSDPSQPMLHDVDGTQALLCNASNMRQGRRGPTTKVCEFCGLFLRHPSKIAAHMRTHTGERPFTCEFCGQDFSQRTPYRMHVKRHTGDLPFFCSICNKKFPSNASRNGHEIRVHRKMQRQGAPRPHLKPAMPIQALPPPENESRPPVVGWEQPCTMQNPVSSDSAIQRISGVVDAVASGVPPNQPQKGWNNPTIPLIWGETSIPPATADVINERRYEDRHPPTVARCTQCGLIFKHPSKIQAHLRTHTGEKPFVCEHCGLGCSTNSALRVHIRRFHTGERPHVCTWNCGRRFVSVAARNEHERIVHAGVKRYQCSVGNCQRLFTRRSYMVKHLLSHTGKSNIPADTTTTTSFLRLAVPSVAQQRAADELEAIDDRMSLDPRALKADEGTTNFYDGNDETLLYASALPPYAMAYANDLAASHEYEYERDGYDNDMDEFYGNDEEAMQRMHADPNVYQNYRLVEHDSRQLEARGYFVGKVEDGRFGYDEGGNEMYADFELQAMAS